MKCVADRDYRVVHTGHYENSEIAALICQYCAFQIRRCEVAQPRSSKSGLGRYNRMRGIMVRHLHSEHRDELERGEV